MGKGEQTRQQIISQALSLVAHQGLDGLSLGALAESMSMSKSGLFAHFKSKEALSLAVLNEVVEQFTRQVVLPSLKEPRGLPRLTALFEADLVWVRGTEQRVSCPFMTLAQEYSGRPGAIRDQLVTSQRDWRATISRIAKGAVDEGQLRADVDVQQLAFEFQGIELSFQQSHRLLGDRSATSHARAAFAGLIERARPTQS